MFYAAKTLVTTFITDDGANQPAKISIERNVSILSELLAKDRHFLSDKINYMCVHYNLPPN